MSEQLSFLCSDYKYDRDRQAAHCAEPPRYKGCGQIHLFPALSQSYFSTWNPGDIVSNVKFTNLIPIQSQSLHSSRWHFPLGSSKHLPTPSPSRAASPSPPSRTPRPGSRTRTPPGSLSPEHNFSFSFSFPFPFSFSSYYCSCSCPPLFLPFCSLPVPPVDLYIIDHPGAPLTLRLRLTTVSFTDTFTTGVFVLGPSPARPPPQTYKCIKLNL